MRKRKKVISKNMIEVLDYHTSRTYRRNGKRVKKEKHHTRGTEKAK